MRPSCWRSAYDSPGPAKGALHAALFEVENGEPSGDESSRFGRRLLDELVVGTGEELVGLAETARGDQRMDMGSKQAPPVPRFVGLGYRSAGGGSSEELDGVVNATEPGQAVADHEVRGAERT